MRFVHDGLDPEYRSPLRAVCAGEGVTLRVRVAGGGTRCCRPELLLTRRFRTETQTFTVPCTACEHGMYVFELGGELLSGPGTYYYAFAAGGEESGNAGRITVTAGAPVVPDWFKNTVIYQIFPDRFAIGTEPGAVRKPDSFLYASADDLPMYIKDADNEIIRWEFYGGNLAGVREQLDYIEDLGAGTVYLNPIFESVSNHRYDTGDYEHVDGLLGGDRAFEALVGSMNSRGLRLILDGVFSHTGRNSRYFRAALNGERPYADWYNFRPDGSWECWWGVKDLPCVKELDPSYLEYIVTGTDSIVRRWLRAGASGWRLDVADELPDEFIAALTQAAREEKPDAVVFGEVWEDGTDKVSYGVHRSYYTVPELHSQTNYPFRTRLLAFFEGTEDAYQLSRQFAADAVNYPRDVYYSLINMTGSHDVRRLFSCFKELAGADNAPDLMRAYALVQFCFPGVPLIYYGDELGMEGGTDPDNRRFFDWKSAKSETSTGGRLRRWFAELAALRKREAALVSGAASFRAADADVFAFVRTGQAGERFVCGVDRRGRGPEYIAAALCDTFDFFNNSEYNIIKQAGGYGVLFKNAAK